MINNQQANQSLHWADKLAQGIIKWGKKNKIQQFHVDDMKTPSGRIHVGSLRGVLIHDLVSKVLQHKKQKVINTYVFNDMDPMDSLPYYLDQEKYTQHMGEPFYKIPKPNLEKCGIDFERFPRKFKKYLATANNMAELYAFDFIDSFRNLGCDAKIIWSHELYESGAMDKVIKIALNKVETIKRIYKKIADYDLPDNWYPFQVICPKCGKIGTTLVTDWDGEEVTFECKKEKVDWAQGCGYKGTISPFGGNGKFLWKVDWPAHWTTMKVNIEGAGKDHTSAGGSRDMANALLKQVFDYVVPFDIPYEFFLLRGAKMSSSKGIGTSARDFVNLLPPEIGRFLFVNKHYNQVVDFDPRTDTVLDLYDEYDLAARIYWKKEQGDQRLARSYELAQIDSKPVEHYVPRFRDLIIWIQYPEINTQKQLKEDKGSELTDLEQKIVRQRIKHAKYWLKNFAPKKHIWTVSEDIPDEASNLTEDQIIYLERVNENIDNNKQIDPHDLQQQMYELAKQSLGARKAFQAVYLAFLGKKAGPRAGWFLLSIESKLRKQRIKKIKEKFNKDSSAN